MATRRNDEKKIIAELKKGDEFLFNQKLFRVKQKFNDWKKDDEPYLKTECDEIFYHDGLIITQTFKTEYDMSKATINGHTLDYIKGKAKHIKKEIGVKHSEALELAAKTFGFKSYKDCINQFKNKKL